MKDRCAAICGRFQPFHNDHFKYLMAALAEYELVICGLVKPFPVRLGSGFDAAHRSAEGANPFTYAERMEMIMGTVLESGENPGRIQVVPFPLDEPDSLFWYVDKGVPILTTNCDEWSEQKLRILCEAGYNARSLYDVRGSRLASTTIRRLIQEGSTDWMSLVSNSTARVIQRKSGGIDAENV